MLKQMLKAFARALSVPKIMKSPVGVSHFHLFQWQVCCWSWEQKKIYTTNIVVFEATKSDLHVQLYVHQFIENIIM